MRLRKWLRKVLPRRSHKSKSQPDSGPSEIRDPSFPLESLPQELQDIVWLWALHIATPPVVTLLLPSEPPPGYGRQILVPTPPAVFHVSRATRQLLLKEARKSGCLHSLRLRRVIWVIHENYPAYPTFRKIVRTAREEQWLFFNPHCQALELSTVRGIDTSYLPTTLAYFLPTLMPQVQHLHVSFPGAALATRLWADTYFLYDFPNLRWYSTSARPLLELYREKASWSFNECWIAPGLWPIIYKIQRAGFHRLAQRLGELIEGGASWVVDGEPVLKEMGITASDLVCEHGSGNFALSRLQQAVPRSSIRLGGEVPVLEMPLTAWDYRPRGQYGYCQDEDAVNAEIFKICREGTRNRLALKLMGESKMMLPVREENMVQNAVEGRVVWKGS
ncbi:hypothetical protein BU26DRAFT_608376 [Trematosphaeria pertusa]|uniref:Uncharacterized protein n=1 Tax=Trematosphaeria pertusa TaxID=390896 RepID=A0A6A6I5N0_9PLEO|nr:uncharacterized protein BU26DRAFT_608376 [Trematosphaeria pertusa]KAF2244873.1 hypothetical protein BU26DRAFT_608376 [Trematosphaeria pertusa]